MHGVRQTNHQRLCLPLLTLNIFQLFSSPGQNACYEDDTAQAVIQRLSNLTGIDDANSEYLQLLRYETGQFYKTHVSLFSVLSF